MFFTYSEGRREEAPHPMFCFNPLAVLRRWNRMHRIANRRIGLTANGFSGESMGKSKAENKGTYEDVSALCERGRLRMPLRILQFAKQRSTGDNYNAYACLLQWCINMRSLEEGKRVHAHMIKVNRELDIFLRNNIVNMYVKCGNIIDARHVFDKMPERNDVSWNAIIAGYAQHGYGEEALNLFCQMQRAGQKPDNFTFASVLKACANLTALEQGKQVHSYVIHAGFESDVFVGSTLVDMYAKCGIIQIARKVFDIMPRRHVISWNAMITGYAQKGNGEDALKLFHEIQQAGMKATPITFAGVLSACTSIPALEPAKQVHALILKIGFEEDILVVIRVGMARRR